MSKAFTKEEDGTEKIRLDDLPQSTHPNLVTPSGLADLKARLAAARLELENLRARPEEIDSTMAIAVAERDIRFLESRISKAILIDPKDHSSGVVEFGATIDVVNEEDEQLTFRIVGEDEANPAQGLIAPYSPLGVALLGGETGGTVEWQKPSGVVELEIIAIRFE
ncbi:GreA/GreB family elongation factor [Sulfitobacter mediterraneus]|uniref:GreA/GreB family elongation factor n=1 Tax=Sulfitobacter mediterraneus TaxID=83219 RepID=UPI0024928EA6|nr:GreA/GreB family elongation factor [Sulfitobacter mediterraneus]